MENKKNFEAFATNLFGNDYGKQKAGKAPVPWSDTYMHPQPFDVIVMDKNENVLTDYEKETKNKTGIGKRSKDNRNMGNNDGRLTPIVIDMIDSPFDNNPESPALWKRQTSELSESHKNVTQETIFLDINNDETEDNEGQEHAETLRKKLIKRKSKKKETTIERLSSERDDSGISLNDEGEDGALSFAEGENISTNGFREPTVTFACHEDSESDNDLAYFCVDHMKMCKSRTDLHRHRRCHLDSTKASIDSPVVSPNATSSCGSREELDKVELRTPSSLRGSRNSNRAGTSLAVFLGMRALYLETLDKLYSYSGVIIADRESLKTHLQDRKSVMEDEMLECMEEMITSILKLKNQFLAELNSDHRHNLVRIAHQAQRLHTLRHETRLVWKALQVPNELSDFKKYREIIRSAAERTSVIEKTLRDTHGSADNYSYELETAPELSAMYERDNVAYVHEVTVTPALPPFLSSLPSNADDPESDYTSLKNVEGISNVSGKQDIESKNCCFTGCAYISTESVLLVDWTNGVIKMLNKYALVADILEFEKSPWDVVQSLDGQVAVTVPKLQTVFFVEAEPHLRIVGKFNTRCECFGICKMEDKYAITCDPWSKLPSVRVFDKFGNVLIFVQTDSIGEQYFRCPLHVCSDYFNTVIYVSDSTANCVYAISLSGDIMFCYQHNDLEYPTGVATDRNNCLYICGKSSANIHKISNTGELLEKFLQKRHGVSNPCAISFHPGGSHMVLTDLAGDIATGYWKLHFM